MRLSKRNKKFIFTLVLFIVVLLTGSTTLKDLLPTEIQKYINTSDYPSNKQINGIQSNNLINVKVVRVIDGDTIEIEGGYKLRYIGINTPETVDTRQAIECFGKKASERNKELVEGKIVRLEKDVSETDRYGRLLRYVYIDNMLINEKLVREGFALSSAYPPDIKYQEKIKNAEKEAKLEKLGLWNECNLNK